MIKEIPIRLVKNLQINGRTSPINDAIPLFWTGSGLEMNIAARELWIEVEVDYDTYEPWLSVVINDSFISRQLLVKGRYWVCIFRNQSMEKIKKVQLIKDVQAMSEDLSHQLLIHAIRTDGTLVDIPKKTMKIEFIGDSITSGEGGIGSIGEDEWTSMIFSGVNNYTYLVGKELNAEYRIISQSGWGVKSGWDNNPNSAIPLIYNKVCGVAKGELNERNGSLEVNDFTVWQPDIVVINLGTNDGSAMQQTAWKEPITGNIYQQQDEREVSSLKIEDTLSSSIADFLKTIRMYNSKATIIWAYGMLGKSIESIIEKGILYYKEETKDSNIIYLSLPEMAPNQVGARWHPGILSHQLAAEAIVETIKGRMDI